MHSLYNKKPLGDFKAQKGRLYLHLKMSLATYWKKSMVVRSEWKWEHQVETLIITWARGVPGWSLDSDREVWTYNKR